MKNVLIFVLNDACLFLSFHNMFENIYEVEIMAPLSQIGYTFGGECI